MELKHELHNRIIDFEKELNKINIDTDNKLKNQILTHNNEKIVLQKTINDQNKKIKKINLIIKEKENQLLVFKEEYDKEIQE